MVEKTPKPNRRKAKTLSKDIATENVGDTTASELYKASAPAKAPPTAHVAIK